MVFDPGAVSMNAVNPPCSARGVTKMIKEKRVRSLEAKTRTWWRRKFGQLPTRTLLFFFGSSTAKSVGLMSEYHGVYVLLMLFAVVCLRIAVKRVHSEHPHQPHNQTQQKTLEWLLESRTGAVEFSIFALLSTAHGH